MSARSAMPAPRPSAPPGRRPPITAIRWGVIAVGLALAATDGEPVAPRVPAALVLVAYATWRSFRPIRHRDDLRTTALVVLEVGLHVLVLEATGFWHSPFEYSLIAAIVVAGFARGFAFALQVSLVSVVAVALPYHLTTDDPPADALRRTGQGAVQLALVGVVAGYARRVLGEAEERHSVALDRLGRLAEANTLLYSLHSVAQALPSSLDLEEVLDSTATRLRALFEPTSLGVFLPDETSSSWFVARQEGLGLADALGAPDLPAPVREAARGDRSLVSVRPGAGSGLYAPLRARGALVGVLAVEHTDPHRFGPGDVSLLDGFTEAAALAIDNARWFRRLRTVGADEERTRIARELHDGVGQSLAYVAFEMDRLRSCRDPELRTGVEALRDDVRRVLGEVREALSDLRTDVSEEADFVETVRPFLERVERRSGLAVALEAEQRRRLPLLQEREMWRIAQEAVTNAERHSGATSVEVRWACDGVKARLEVADNGRGFDPSKAGRMDSYGILGMRERAAGIGATLAVSSAPGQGSAVRCELEPTPS